MKNFKLFMAGILILGSLATAFGQHATVKVYPRHGTVVSTLYQPKIYVYQGKTYHFAAGVWYKTRGKHYVVCAAPAGIQLRRLPRGHRVVYLHGRKYFKYKGIWYAKRGRNYRVVYV